MTLLTLASVMAKRVLELPIELLIGVACTNGGYNSKCTPGAISVYNLRVPKARGKVLYYLDLYSK